MSQIKPKYRKKAINKNKKSFWESDVEDDFLDEFLSEFDLFIENIDKYEDDDILKLVILMEFLFDFNYSVLNYAVLSGSIEFVKFLLCHKSLIEIDSNSVSPLHFAAALNDVDIGKVLLGKIDINAVDYSGQTPLLYAIINHSTEFIKFLFNSKNIDVNIESILKF